ncbi:zf-HC2 domain-containing protein [Corynebacterium tapiri]|uniref:zf-HC2 domain-containing protein n=1 Tax=Corynebacterium tapiri TaxID=1448266 RepID=UPI0015D5EE02|nr:zf-HC2 domain-containing protein [Corynebacterium tapiri]
MIEHERIQAALSARLDGESSGIPDDIVDAHVANCPECQDYKARVVSLSDKLSFIEPQSTGMAPPQNFSDTILAGVESEWRRRTSPRLAWLAGGRITVAVLAVAYLGWALVLLAGADDIARAQDWVDPQLFRLSVEAAGLRFALAVGLALCAWKPSLIPGFVVVPATLTAFLVGFTVRDIVLGEISMADLLSLAAILVTVLILVGTWVAHAGVQLRQAWRSLSANPS